MDLLWHSDVNKKMFSLVVPLGNVVLLFIPRDEMKNMFKGAQGSLVYLVCLLYHFYCLFLCFSVVVVKKSYNSDHSILVDLALSVATDGN